LTGWKVLPDGGRGSVRASLRSALARAVGAMEAVLEVVSSVGSDRAKACSPSDPLSTIWLSVHSAGPRPILCPMARTSSAGAIDAERRSGKPPLEGLVAATAIRLVGSVSDDRLDAAEARMRRQRGTLDPGSEGGSHRPARSDGSLLPVGGASTRER
jgi:hypothetical protein